MEVKTQFKDWVVRRISEAMLLEGTDYLVLLKNEQNLQGGRPLKEYKLTLDAAKHIAMLEGNDKGRQARQYFIDFEKKARQLLASLPKTDDEIIAQGCLLAQKRLIELR